MTTNTPTAEYASVLICVYCRHCGAFLHDPATGSTNISADSVRDAGWKAGAVVVCDQCAGRFRLPAAVDRLV